jgi:hypothetical protein
MVAAQERGGAVVNAAIAQAKAVINVEIAGVGVVAVEAGPLSPPLTPLEVAFTEIGFLVDSASILTSPSDQNITLPSLASMDDAEVKTLCATLRKPGGGE